MNSGERRRLAAVSEAVADINVRRLHLAHGHPVPQNASFTVREACAPPDMDAFDYVVSSWWRRSER